MLQVGELLLDCVRHYPDRLSIVDKNRALTYFELNQESNCVANALKALGVRKGDIVTALMKNRVEWVIMWYACQKIGAVVAPLHVRLRSNDLAELVRFTDSQVLIYEDDCVAAAEAIHQACGERMTYICIGSEGVAGDVQWETFWETPDYTEAQISLSSDDPSLILYTSGTTGMAKGVVRTQEMVALHGIVLSMRNNHPYVVDVMMSTSPLHHIGGFQALMKMHVLGGTFITLSGVQPDVAVELIEKYKVTQLQMLPPATYERLYLSDAWKNADLSSVWEVCVSAGKCTKEYTDHIFEMFPNCHLRPSWGSTEAASITCMQMYREELERNPGMINAIGYIMPLTQMRIVDQNGNDVEPGASGEALVKSPMVITGYLKNTVSRDRVFVDGDWFRTGDIVRFDPKSGGYYFMDRIKDMIKTGGENVYALEIERVIQQHPHVHECAVIGVPDRKLGEAVGAAIVLSAGGTLTAEELTEFCKNRLPSFKKPRYWAVMDQLPCNPVGKVQKNILRENAQETFSPIFD